MGQGPGGREKWWLPSAGLPQTWAGSFWPISRKIRLTAAVVYLITWFHLLIMCTKQCLLSPAHMKTFQGIFQSWARLLLEELAISYLYHDFWIRFDKRPYYKYFLSSSTSGVMFTWKHHSYNFSCFVASDEFILLTTLPLLSSLENSCYELKTLTRGT